MITADSAILPVWSIREAVKFWKINRGDYKIGNRKCDPMYYYFNRLWDCPEGGSSNPGPGNDVHCGPPATVDRGSNAIPVHPLPPVVQNSRIRQLGGRKRP